MDAVRFDALSRRLGQSSSRRTLFGGLTGALSALLGVPATDGSGQRKRGRLEADGPCGNGGPKANRCQRHRDCCTRYCDRRRGRCRCRKQGQSCTRNRNCCQRGGQDLGCFGRRCQVRGRCGTGGPCRVFITSARYQGDLREDGQDSGIAGADAKCQALADASLRTQGGAYKAWLSDSSPASGPATRFTNTANTGPYLLVDDAGTEIARDWADLTGGSLLAPILVTELGQEPGARDVWTHTLPDGTPGGERNAHCRDWTNDEFPIPGDDEGDAGDANAVDSQWTRWDARRFCDGELHLYCFEQG